MAITPNSTLSRDYDSIRDRQNSDITKLSRDVLLHIFSFLDLCSLARTARVSREFKAVVLGGHSSKLWLRFALPGLPVSLSYKAVFSQHNNGFGSAYQQTELKRDQNQGAHRISNVSISENGQRIVTGSIQDKNLSIWDTKGNEVTHIPSAVGQSIGRVKISPDGSVIVSAAPDLKYASVWNETDGGWEFSHNLETTVVTTFIDISQTALYIATGSSQKVTVWRGAEPTDSIQGNKLSFTAFSPDEAHLVIGASFSNQLTVQKLNQQLPPNCITLGDCELVMNLTASIEKIAVALMDGTVKIVGFDGSMMQTLAGGHTTSVTSVAFLEGLFVTGSYDGRVCVWNQDYATLEATLTTPNSPTTKSVGLGMGKTIVAATDAMKAYVWSFQPDLLERILS
ncbi:MAG: hypothetical protein S4CHLAM45_13790 [Chlamydiales bacterium]|nr:hypothetical protein [Chlamydiales bacterium]MCH9620484.1 hypothetical protein [Chlamydiales bacterium]MCH9623469.1 hypothetical protein [Chlamydiales bacterium]